MRPTYSPLQSDPCPMECDEERRVPDPCPADSGITIDCETGHDGNAVSQLCDVRTAVTSQQLNTCFGDGSSKPMLSDTRKAASFHGAPPLSSTQSTCTHSRTSLGNTAQSCSHETQSAPAVTVDSPVPSIPPPPPSRRLRSHPQRADAISHEPAPLSRASSTASVCSVTSSDTTGGGLRALHSAIGEVLSCGFYHGGLGQQEAGRALQGRPEGTFLLRDSSDSRCLMSISVVTCRGVTSVRVAGSRGNYFLDSNSAMRTRFPQFKTLRQLVAYFMVLSHSRLQFYWVDGNGDKHGAMKLLYPLYTSPPSLAALADFAREKNQMHALMLKTHSKKLNK